MLTETKLCIVIKPNFSFRTPSWVLGGVFLIWLGLVEVGGKRGAFQTVTDIHGFNLDTYYNTHKSIGLKLFFKSRFISSD